MSKHEIGCLNHCPGGGGGGRLFAGIGTAVLIIAGIVGWNARRGIESGLHVVALAGEVVMWTVVAAFVLAVATGVFLVGRKLLRAGQSPPQPARPGLVYRVTQIGTQSPKAIESSHLRDMDWASIKVGIPVHGKGPVR